MPFRDYEGTEFVPYLLPIIPYGAPLSPKTKQLTPEKIGKIPGRRLPDGWVGFPNWQNDSSTDRVLSAYAGWYKDQPCETIGTRANFLLGNDSDFDNNVVRDIVIEEYVKRFGPAPIRTRPNSFKILIPLRLAKGSQAVTKIRRVFTDPWGTIGALEILGRGEQWVMEGMHPSGVQFEWLMGGRPVDVGWDRIPQANYEQVHEFVAAVGERLINELRFVPTKIALSRGGSPGAMYKIGPNHPELCPDLDMLRDVLKLLPCDHPEWDLYDDWMRAVVAIKTACGGDDGFYADVFEPWASEVPENLEEDGFIRAKWDSFTESSIGWLWLTSIAHDHGYYGDVTGVGGFEVLHDEPGKPAAPQGPPASAEYESVIAEQFVKVNARKEWIYTPAARYGTWRRCTDGLWVEDHSVLTAISATCQLVGNAIRRKASMTHAERAMARSMFSAHTAGAVMTLVKARPEIIVRQHELDSHPLLLNVPGGYIDDKGLLREPDPGLLFTRCTGVRPDFSAKCPRWDAQVMLLANGDNAIYECLRRCIGYTSTGTGWEQIFMFLHGRDGGEGKTAFLLILSWVLGTYATTIPNTAFMRRQIDNRFSTSQLDGFWMAYANEIDKGEEWAEARLKEATGGGKMTVEAKYKDAREMPLRFALWFSGNHLPRFRDPDGALRRRTIIFECERSISEAEQKRGYAEALFRAEGPAILAWILDARKDYLREGRLIIPPSVLANRDTYFDSEDKLLQFVNEQCVLGAELTVSKQRFYEAYRSWCKDGSQYPEGRNAVYEKLRTHKKLDQLGVKLDKKRTAEADGKYIHVVSGLRL